MVDRIITEKVGGGKKIITNASVWKVDTLTILTGATGSSIDLATSTFIKYYALAEENGGTNAYGFEMNVFKTNGSPLDTLTNKVGAMSLAVDSVVDGNGMHIDITNNEAYTITVTLTYGSN